MGARFTAVRKLLVVGLIAGLISSAAPSARTEGDVPTVVRVKTASLEQAEYLFTHFDETHNHSNGEVELLLWPGDRARLDALGVDYCVTIENLYARDLALEAQPHPLVHLPGPDRTDYRHLADYNEEMAALAKANPKLVESFEMALPTLEGRKTFGIEIAQDVKNHDDGRPIFYIDAIHHAREWPAGEYTMNFAHYLVEEFGKDPQVTKLLKQARVILVPLQNPDGFNYSRESLAQNSNLGAGNGFEGYWRKNRRSLTGATVPGAQLNPDAFGVDTNRNYSYLWGDSNGGSSGSQVDQTYRGEAPFSEPENQNVQDIILGRNVTMVLTNHTYQGSVLRTGGGEAPDDAEISAIGQRVADILGYNNAPTVGYPTTGTTDDWAYAATGTYGYTIEHGVIGFHPPYADEVGAFNDKHMKAFLVLLEETADPDNHSILKGKVAGGKAAQLTLTKTFDTELSPGNPTGEESYEETIKLELTTAKDGSFTWHVTPSSRPYEKKTESYTLTIKAGGKTTKQKIVVARGQVLNLGTIKL